MLLACIVVFGILRFLPSPRQSTWRIRNVIPLMNPRTDCFKALSASSTISQLVCGVVTPNSSVLSWGAHRSVPFLAEFVHTWYSIEQHQHDVSSDSDNFAVLNIELPVRGELNVNYPVAASAFNTRFDLVLVLDFCPLCAVVASSLLRTASSRMIVSGWDNFSSKLTCFCAEHVVENYALVSPVNKFALRIVVLTWRRFASLQRLLNSLNNARYGSNRLLLEIHIDGKKSNNDSNWNKTVAVANAFRFVNGETRVRVESENRGLAKAWFSAWEPETECPLRTIILEDDIELSPFWFEWLHRVWLCYADRSDLGGITLQRQQIRATDGRVVEIENKGPFLYKLVGSWGFSPNPVFWREFLSWKLSLAADFIPEVPGLIMTTWHKSVKSGSMWTLWWIYFCEQKGLFTLYANAPNKQTLGGNHREVGEHYNSAPKIDFPLVSNWPEQWNHCQLKISRFDWDARVLD